MENRFRWSKAASDLNLAPIHCCFLRIDYHQKRSLISGVKNNHVSALIMVDAALKLEGEKTSEIAEGIGAAIGVEKYRIEAQAVKAGVPMYAVVVKQSLIDAISVMLKEIAEASDKAVAVAQIIIKEKTKEGDTVLIVGVGNTLGVGH